MRTAVKTGINTVTRVMPDGTKVFRYYNRKTGIFLGFDRDAAIQEALSGPPKENLEFAVRLRDPIVQTGLQDVRLSVGNAGEMLAMAELSMGGLIVLHPNTNTAYDFAVDDGNGFWRVQVKTKKSEAPAVKGVCHFQLARRSNGIVLPNYHARGIDIIAFVYWPWRAIILKRASDLTKASLFSLPVRSFHELSPVVTRWEKMTNAMRGPGVATAEQQACNAVADPG